MTIYKHRATVTASAGSVGSSTLNILGGLCRQVLIQANATTTTFRADITDENSVVIRRWAYHKGELNDSELALPLSGAVTVNITNASANDTFTLLLSVEE